MVKKDLISVWVERDEETHHPKVMWEYGNGVNSYFLIGVLEDIKLELLDNIDESSMEVLDG